MPREARGVDPLVLELQAVVAASTDPLFFKPSLHPCVPPFLHPSATGLWAVPTLNCYEHLCGGFIQGRGLVSSSRLAVP